ncbi:MAG: DUF5605 domain-containing protein [Bacillota bacterium]
MGPVTPSDITWNSSVKNQEGDYLVYSGNCTQSAYIYLNLPEGEDFKVNIIDTWEMTVKTIEEIASGKTKIELPEKPYIAVQATKVNH